ncbi:MAG: cobalamin-dependent protein [Candidatus Eiseniibacteriota bacterium]
MNILLYSPDNGVTRNYMPHLWMFLLRSLVPPGHRVSLIDANASPLDEAGLATYIREQRIDLVGIGAMTRMIARAYRMAAAARAAGAKVVMGGPHVTEVPDEALGRTGGPRYADAVALGEADRTWPRIVEDAARDRLEEIYAPVDADGVEQKPGLDDYPRIPWDTIDLEQFNLINLMPGGIRNVLRRIGMRWECFHLLPVETGRGCPYGCEFCTVTGFFGDQIRFRSNQSVVDELLLIKRTAQLRRGKIGVFFIDDNFAIHRKRAKELLREMIARDACVPWVAQISINLLDDDELLDLIRDSGGKFIFCGLESIDDQNLKGVAKSFNRPAEYRATLERMAERGIYAITSFIFGMDHDRPGVADRVLEQVETWPPGLPVFGHLTPYPGTPLYERLEAAGRLERPQHWLDFQPFRMSFTPAGIHAEQVHEELGHAWGATYSGAAMQRTMARLSHRPFHDRVIHLMARLAFRGIYFPQMRASDWARVILDNRRPILRIALEALTLARRQPRRGKKLSSPVPARGAEA